MRRALLLVDVQKNMLEGASPVPEANQVRAMLQSLLLDARARGTAVAHVQNNGGPDDPDEPGTLGWELAFAPLEGELIIEKTQGDAFQEPELAAWLTSQKVDDVIIAGMQSEFCIRQTALGALANGFGALLVRGGHATYGDSSQSASEIAREVEQELSRAGVRIRTARDVWGTTNR